jgi:hypothetical protein
MKRFLPILFTLLYLLAMLKPVMPVFNYIVNHDYIAEYLCINKGKPMLNCDGKCYLSKMIQAEQDEKQKNLPAINLKDYPIGFVLIASYQFINTEVTSKKDFSYSNLYSKSFHPIVYHPPNC